MILKATEASLAYCEEARIPMSAGRWEESERQPSEGPQEQEPEPRTPPGEAEWTQEGRN